MTSPIAVVELTWREVHMCGVGAVSRTVTNLAKHTTPKWGQSQARLNTEDEWTGAIGELAVSKYLDRYWAGINFGTIDASVADVRSISQEGHRLILHPEDRDDLPVVLALVARLSLPKVKLLGWIMGIDGKASAFWQDPGTGRPAFFVPNEYLRPMTELAKGKAA